MGESKLVNFRLQPTEYEGLRILAELTDRTQADIVRDLIGAELVKQKDAIEAYKKSIAKDDSIDATFSGLVKNGTYYCFATIGYLAKLLYNPEFLETIRKYKNDDSLFLFKTIDEGLLIFEPTNLR